MVKVHCINVWIVKRMRKVLLKIFEIQLYITRKNINLFVCIIKLISYDFQNRAGTTKSHFKNVKMARRSSEVYPNLNFHWPTLVLEFRQFSELKASFKCEEWKQKLLRWKSLLTYVCLPISTWWKEKINSQKLSYDFYMLMNKIGNCS